MLLHKPPTTYTSVFPTGDLEHSYYEHFKRLIPHSVRLTAVIAIPNLNCWLFASKNISFPLPHSFGTDQPVLSWLLAGRFSPGTSGAPVGRCWKHTALAEAPPGDSQNHASSVSDIAHEICEVLCRDRGPHRLPLSKRETLWIYAGASSLGVRLQVCKK